MGADDLKDCASPKLLLLPAMTCTALVPRCVNRALRMVCLSLELPPGVDSLQHSNVSAVYGTVQSRGELAQNYSNHHEDASR
ncbi:predicted protein [Plenodomus lingam JN3]|uniref:Predicted protein n=1 Tax=Leptosphaeria maculans (strain JN3 / isolate v23.1.3 / race Av1-4-5-6-7-8) TaxID=985895 RepID=E5A059_LEPMJ|nr:predicted protein [Plenodomus lingam JN3]CBX96919.1 predicted protein [Plenodomus lingam JN3]